MLSVLFFGGGGCEGRREWVKKNLTAEDGVDRCKIGADGHDDHGQGEGEELQDYVAGSVNNKISHRLSRRKKEAAATHAGTAGVMLDFSPAAEPVSSWSRMVFSSEIILRVAIVLEEGEKEGGRWELTVR